MSRIVILLLLFAFGPLAGAQETVLDQYLKEGLTRNRMLQQERLGLAQQVEAVQQARGGLLPKVSVEARYTRAGGGREIQFPVGDLLNPVYGTLNEQRIQQGLPPSFPTVDNEVIPFLREREQDTRLRVVQPLYQPAIRHNLRIQQHLAQAEAAGVAATKRQLVADIKTSYFNYLQAEQVVEIFAATHALVAENLRVNESLLAHGKVTEDAVLRARTEVLNVVQQEAEAHKNRDLARAYFNYLLARPLDTPIEVMPPEQLLPEAEAQFVAFAEPGLAPGSRSVDGEALARREEVQALGHALRAADRRVSMTRTAYHPTLAFVLDTGMQGETYEWGDGAGYWMGSVSLSWDLFEGFQRRSQRQQAQLAQQQLVAQQAEVQAQIRLQAQEARDNVAVSRRALETAQERAATATEAFRLVARKYSEGMVNQVAFLDARTARTQAELNLVATRYALLTRYAAFERAAALYAL